MTETTLVYRALLRAMKNHITSPGVQDQWKRFVIAEFTTLKQDADPEKRQRLLQLAKDYTFLMNSVREHKNLLLSYNIGIDVETREKQMNQRAAKLVGLSIPNKQH